ncbi:hypothetical protein OG871_16940 [Kitasatospora sp. NBC_00374]|uniref:hypothetical protein n=1 Tax=Kitasatospora sp. NBC_00374 TaxID=2975964 RepID=UPI0030E39995
MSAEIADLVNQAGPYLTAALTAYGSAVLTKAEDAAADATANLGRRILQTVWHRRSEPEQAELEAAVQEAAEEINDEDAAAALRQQIKRALRDDTDLRSELAQLLPPQSPGTVTATASGLGAIAAGRDIRTAITGGINRPAP